MIKKMISFFTTLAVFACLFTACAVETGKSNSEKDQKDQSKEEKDLAQITAAVVADKELSGVELSYFYIDVINNYCNQYNDYLQYFIDTSIPLDEQYFDEESGQTWADYFVDLAVDSAKNNYALYNAAKAAGHTLSAEEQATTEELSSELKTVAKSYGYRSANAYLEALYGDGASLESYKAYYEVAALASSYYTAYTEQIEAEITDADLRAYETDKLYEYNSYSYASYYMDLDTYKSDNTTDAEAALKAAAKAFMEQGDFSLADENHDVRYSNVNSAIQEWIRGERLEGDVAMLPYSPMDSTGVEGYYVVQFRSVNDNTFPLKDVRHILVSYEDDSDAAKDAAKNAAQSILDEWQKGDQTEASFAALAKENTTDADSQENGGLCEAVYPGQMMAPIEAWCFDEARMAGDTGIVQSEYGYHVMYFCGDNELSYRDYMVRNDLLAEAITDWQTALNDATSAELKSSEHLELDLVLNDIDEG